MNSTISSDATQLHYFLGTGEKRATKQPILAAACGWFDYKGSPNTRKVQHALEDLRDAGIMAVSNQYGTFIAETDEELCAFRAQLTSRISGTRRTIRQIERELQTRHTGSLFRPCRHCFKTISTDLLYCSGDCRQAFHTEARLRGYRELVA